MATPYHPSLAHAHTIPCTLPTALTNDTCRTIFRALEEEGFHALFVGGCVRDSLLKRPIYDIDIATTAKPAQTIESLKKYAIATYPTGIDHGTITARLNNQSFEITSLRIDTKHFGRHAHVSFSQDWQQDAQRRDFTMNALYAHIDGTLYDFFHGITDLQQRHIRFIGDPLQRIREDYLRILRYFRFTATYGQHAKRHQQPQERRDALNACATLAPHLRSLSPQRIWKEIRILLRTKNPYPTLRLMATCHIFSHLPTPIPPHNIAAIGRLIALDKHHGGNRPLRRAACMLYRPPHQHGKTSRPLTHAWRLSHKEQKHIERLFRSIEQREERYQHPLAHWRTIRYKDGLHGVRDCLLLHYSHHRHVHHHVLPLWRACLYTLTIGIIIRKAAMWKAPSFPLKGQDILHMGIPPGPRVGALLARTERWWLNKHCRPNANQCKQYAQTIHRTMP
ncbi:MAG: CCA tRNA nucleotidyltransferase [Alphaproteobacteria bacterium GM7ARS4]|nr:CCA tRNA nucleotidyltransferase [Alphaproteobacteria bacterium GM7ARS4]